MKKVDMNCDMGESMGAYKLGLDEEVVKFITSANIACGFHAGDPDVMAKTVDLAVAQGVAVGAHPGYPDLLGFGRRNMDVTVGEVKNMVTYQIGALEAFTRTRGQKLQHVKPHGALYNTAAINKSVARAIAEAVYDFNSNLILMALAGSELEKAAREVGLRCASEVFADRNYNSDGTLVSRRHPQAIIHDSAEAAKRMVDIILQGKITAIDGTVFTVKADSICVHGDTPGAIEHVKQLREALLSAGIEVVAMGEFVQ